jgi:hypothetical protein
MSGKDDTGRIPMPDLAAARAKTLAQHHAQVLQKRGGGGGGSRVQGFVETRNIDSTEWSEIVDVKGRGRLTAVGVAGGQYSHRFRIEIDGRTVVADTLASAGPSARNNNGLGVDLPFEEHLRVEGCDGPRGSALARYWVCYVLEPAHLAEEATTSTVIGEREQQLTMRRFERDGETVATVTASLGPRFASEVQLLRDWVPFEPEGPRGVGLTGRVVVLDLTGEEDEEVLPEATAIIRPAGRWSPVAEISLVGEDGPEPYRSWPGRGEYSVTADLPGVSNRPTFFTVL